MFVCKQIWCKQVNKNVIIQVKTETNISNIENFNCAIVKLKIYQEWQMKRKKYFRLFKLNNIFNSQSATLLKQLLYKEHFAGKFLKIFKTAFLQDRANVCFWIVLDGSFWRYSISHNWTFFQLVSFLMCENSNTSKLIAFRG